MSFVRLMGCWFLCVGILMTTAEADVGSEDPRPFVMTEVPTIDATYIELGSIHNEILEAERRIREARVRLVRLMTGSEDLPIEVAIVQYRSRMPTGLSFRIEERHLRIVTEDGATDEALAQAAIFRDSLSLLSQAKTSLIPIPGRLIETQSHLVRISEQAPATARRVCNSIGERRRLIRTIEENQVAADRLPIMASETVQAANLILNQLTELAD